MTRSFQAGIEAAKSGNNINNNINNSYPFDHDEFVEGYKTIKPDSKTMLDQLTDPADRLAMLKIMEITKNG